ncbi:MAG: SusC/RagA family TonB-linked outer membrane protein [Bacteroidales bacterium]|nr:SusC/RagA family TonB-linked outer membrane protein [Bacteroidales bacterium]MDD2425924.1 SusC/RagA family TonB-linked outer membrane protein [Bacteroidales bacterium]MDD3990336.1 SusC/RagA family TonB-linked outer membrane protein [Bacteroidales bacterium]
MKKIESEQKILNLKAGFRLKQLSVLLIALLMMVPKDGFSQKKVNLNITNATLKTALANLKSQSGMNFVYNTKEVDDGIKVSAKISDKTLDEALNIILKSTPYAFERVKDYILITLKSQEPKKITLRSVSGFVTDENDDPMVGVGVILDGTTMGQATDDEGKFEFLNNIPDGAVLLFSFIGYETQRIPVGTSSLMRVKMKRAEMEIDELVFTGMFTRRAESFTGSATTFKGEELLKVANQNLITGIKNLDPSFIVAESMEFGSDPNKLPEIQMRGQTSIPNLRGDYEGNPNLPLFILDGFETTIEKVYDLNINLIQSVTLLKDAAAKAIYGSKAANGVVVIETTPPVQGRLRVSYNGNLNVNAPDLTSYNLCNAAQKLQAEVLADKYYSTNPATQASLIDQYNELYKEVLRGVDTYWLSQPLRTGIGQKHSAYIDGGDAAMRYSASIGYNRIQGVMKGSDRQTISGNVSLFYRWKSLTFRNTLSIDNNNSNNSLYGSFSEYANMNPYWRIYDENGLLIKNYGNNIYNPLYDATVGGKDRSGYNMITENFYGEWSPVQNLKFTTRFGISIQNSESELFKPSSHSDYLNIPVWDDRYVTRGQYTKTSGQSMNTALDAGVNYTLNKGKHVLFANATFSISQNNAESYATTVLGFPSDKLDYIGAGNNYADGKPTGMESTTRALSVTTAFNYSYDNRYLADFSWRLNGSSQFGSKNRFGKFWSAGIGWNLHNESFMKDSEYLQMFKLRASIGYTGSQNFNAYQAISSYNYITNQIYNGDMGLVISSLANEGLKWQRQLDRNIGADIQLFKIATLRLDFYSNITRDLLADITVAPSVGFPTYKENLGETLNRGYQIGSSFRVYSDNTHQRYVNINFNLAHNSNKVRKISDALKAYNESVDAMKEDYAVTDLELLNFQRDPSTRFEEGQSLSAIWAVPSLGINPVNGREVFVKKDGTTTYEWAAADQVVCGDSNPKLNGNIGANIGWGGFNLNFAFTFKYGGQTYNSTLVDKIENVDINNNNVDLRALTERWNTPGIEAKYKSIKDYTTTKTTSRFVEDMNEFLFSSISIDYDLCHLKLLKKSVFERLKINFNMNDVGRISTVGVERGTSYPFARTFSFGLQANF